MEYICKSWKSSPRTSRVAVASAVKLPLLVQLESPAAPGDAAGGYGHSEVKDNGIWNSDGGVEWEDVGVGDVQGDAGDLRWCTEHILGWEGAGLPPPADLAVGQGSASAKDYFRGGWPICGRCLGTVVDNTSHLGADVQGQEVVVVNEAFYRRGWCQE